MDKTTELKLQDYLHFYLGAPCLIGDSKEVDYIRMVNETGLSVCTGTNKVGIPIWYKTSSCKPILQNLIGLDNKRFTNLTSYEYWNDVPDDINNWFGARAQMIKELLDGHFDLFGLIPAGLAIDSTTITN